LAFFVARLSLAALHENTPDLFGRGADEIVFQLAFELISSNAISGQAGHIVLDVTPYKPTYRRFKRRSHYIRNAKQQNHHCLSKALAFGESDMHILQGKFPDKMTCYFDQ
jgi:hypothetical protein